MEWPGDYSVLHQLGNEHLASLESCLSDAVYILKPMATIYYHLSFSQNVCTLGEKASLTMKMKVKSLSHVRLFATPWTVAYQAPPSMGFSRQEYWSGWVTISFSRGSSLPRDWTRVSRIGGRHFNLWATMNQTIYYQYLCFLFLWTLV